jgi:signal peptidase I
MEKFKIVSDSMAPLIVIGDEIIIKKIDSNYKFKKFDIILYKQGEKLFCHYFWHQNKNFDQGFVITRSLKNGFKDYPFSHSNIIGLVQNFKIGLILKIKILMRDLLIK